MTKLRHLIDPQDFTVEELEKLFSLADEIVKDEKNLKMCVMERFLPLYFMNQVLELDLALKQQCLDLEGR